MIERIRKQVYLLTQKDLQDHPIWEFCTDEEDLKGQDEATVKPSCDEEVPGYSPGAYVVAADISFADGTKGIGYVYSSKPDDLSCLQPTVVLDNGQINFWLGYFQGAIDQGLEAHYKLMKKAANEVFPLSVATRSKINGTFLAATLDGFKIFDPTGPVLTRR